MFCDKSKKKFEAIEEQEPGKILKLCSCLKLQLKLFSSESSTSIDHKELESSFPCVANWPELAQY